MPRPGGEIRLRTLEGGSPQASDAIRLAPCGQRQAPDALVLVETTTGGPQAGASLRLYPCMAGGGGAIADPIAPPEAPAVSIADTTPTSLHANWLVEANPPVQGYIATLTRDDGVPGETIETADTSGEWGNLEPFHAYTVSVVAINDAGTGPAGSVTVALPYPPPFRGPAPVTGIRYSGTPAQRLRPHTTPGWQSPPGHHRHINAPHSAGTPQHRHQASAWGRLPPRPRETGVPWGPDLDRHESDTRSGWGDLPPNRRHTAAAWGPDLPPLHRETHAPHGEPPNRRVHTRHSWGATHPLARLLDALHRAPPPLRTHTRVPWGAVWRITLFVRPDPPPPAPAPCYTPPPGDAVALALRDPWRDTPGDAVHLTLGCPAEPPANEIPTLKVYRMIHEIRVVRVDDQTEIDATALQLSLDTSSHSWTFSGTLVGAEARDAVQPGEDGEPVELEVTLNGYTWRVIAEEWAESREFGRRGVSVEGRGRSARLTQPYLRHVSGQVSAPISVQQAFASLLPVDQDWTVEWDDTLADWLLPEGSWSWGEGTPLSIIHQAATDVGMVVVPDRAERTLRFRPRYPVLPWQYDQAEPDLAIPDAAILRLTRQQPLATQANAVYVHGGDTGGRLIQVSREGTAADRLAPTQTSDLITNVDAGRLLGGRILAGQHRQPAVRRVTMPLGGGYPLPSIADLIQIELGGQPERATLQSVQVEATRDRDTTRVRQTLGFGEVPDNVWARFQRLLPYDPLKIGTVQANHADGTVTVELVGGGEQRVRGDTPTGTPVYVRAGRIEDEAPDLPQDSITV